MAFPSLSAFSLQRQAANPVFHSKHSVGASEKCSEAGSALPVPCLSAPVTHTAEVCVARVSLATRNSDLTIAKSDAEAICLKRGLGSRNLPECGYR